MWHLAGGCVPATSMWFRVLCWRPVVTSFFTLCSWPLWYPSGIWWVVSLCRWTGHSSSLGHMMRRSASGTSRANKPCAASPTKVKQTPSVTRNTKTSVPLSCCDLISCVCVCVHAQAQWQTPSSQQHQPTCFCLTVGPLYRCHASTGT